MALIKCPECGREISDKAAACVHCGYPIPAPAPHAPAANTANASAGLSIDAPILLVGPENARTKQSVFVQKLGRKVEFTIPNNSQVGQVWRVHLVNSTYPYVDIRFSSVQRFPATNQQSTAAPKPKPKSTPNPAPNPTPAAPNPASSDSSAIALIKLYKPNGFVAFLASRRFYTLMILYVTFIGTMFAEGGLYDACIGAVGLAPFFLPLLIAKFLYPLHHLKKYLKRQLLESAIQNDQSPYSVAVAVYNQLPRKNTLAYLKSMNPAAGLAIELQLAARKK